MRLLVYLFLLTLAALLIWGAYVVQERRFATEVAVHSFSNDTIVKKNKIALLGDSWVADGQIQIGIDAVLAPRIKTEAFGQGGAKTKGVYKNLFLPVDRCYSSNKVLTSGQYKIAVIVAGVNDVTSHLGADFYTHHILLICRALKKQNITPVVLEVPEFGVLSYFEKRTITKRWIKDIPMKMLFDGGLENPRTKYAYELRKKLQYEKEIYLIRFDDFIDDYIQNQSLYSDPAHLTQEASGRLGVFIGEFLKENVLKENKPTASEPSHICQ